MRQSRHMQAAEGIEQPVCNRVGINPRHCKIQQQFQCFMIVQAIQPLRSETALSFGCGGRGELIRSYVLSV